MKTPLFDLSKLKEISKGNEQFVQKMVQIFIEETPIAIAELTEAFEGKDVVKVNKIAHKIKPSIDFMGIASITNEIRFVEKNAETITSLEELKLPILKINEVLTQVVKKLKEIDV